MAKQIQFEVLIDGELKVSPFSSFTLVQRINEHHEFTLSFSQDIKKGTDALSINKYSNYLGRTISVKFGNDFYSEKNNQDESLFIGLITEIGMSDKPFDNDQVVIKGKSPSILLESVESCSSFTEKNLDQIIKHFAQNIDTNVLGVEVNSTYKKPIPFVFQYNESNYGFIKRLSADYGQWFYYDGRKLHFGRPSKLPPDVKLNYPVDISHMKLNMKVAPSGFKRNAYSFKNKDDKFEVDGNSIKPVGLGNFGNKAIETSDKVFTSESVSPSLYRSGTKADLEDFSKIQRGYLSSNLVTLSARSDNPHVHVGSIVDISKNSGEDEKSESTVGKFLVIKVIHALDGNGNYSNNFEAIPSEVDFLPPPKINRPNMKPMIGSVIGNKDPDGKGKVKVQLILQAGAGKFETTWIPCMTPSAGAGGRGKNRGFHFIPEIGDFVIVGFADNDPSRPYVQGSIPLAENVDSNPNKDNFEKVISTRSGNTIFFRDKDSSKEQEIRIETDESNLISILVKGGDGSITIQSTKEITVESTKTIHVKSEKITVEGKDIEVNATNAIAMKANKKISIESAQVEISASSDLKAKGTNVKVEGSAVTEVKGTAKLSLTASGQTELKGAMVMIN